MAKGYWVVNLSVDDPEVYREYTDLVRPYLASVGGRFIVRGGEAACVEGSSLPRIVIVEFDSLAAARAAYDAPEYQQMVAIRQRASKGNFVIAEGFD